MSSSAETAGSTQTVGAAGIAEAAAATASSSPGVVAGAPGWDCFAERPVPGGLGETVSPEAELAGLLQRRQDDLSAARGSAADSAAEARGTLFELASLIGRLEQLVVRAEGPMADGGQRRLHRQLRVLKDQMLQSLGEGGIEVRDPLGLSADAVADWVDTVGWRQGGQFTEEVVAQTDEAAVFHDGAVVRYARVIMGAPDPQQGAGDRADSKAPAETDATTDTAAEGAPTAVQDEATSTDAPDEVTTTDAQDEPKTTGTQDEGAGEKA